MNHKILHNSITLCFLIQDIVTPTLKISLHCLIFYICALISKKTKNTFPTSSALKAVYTSLQLQAMISLIYQGKHEIVQGFTFYLNLWVIKEKICGGNASRE